jgi:hypothetical protein
MLQLCVLASFLLNSRVLTQLYVFNVSECWLPMD